jgi:Lar family restriction alleviation protein
MRETETPTTNLLPCPFCGGEPVAYEIPPHTHKFATFMPDHPGSFVIECSCGIGLIHENKDTVIAAWNRRALRPEGVWVPVEIDSNWIANYAEKSGQKLIPTYVLRQQIQWMLDAAPGRSGRG